jgi:hypothetical protein
MFCVRHRTLSAIKRVTFASDRMSLIVLTDRLCNNIFLNVHATSEEKSDDKIDSFCDD